MSIFRNSSFRLRKRDKAQQPSSLEETPEHADQPSDGDADMEPHASGRHSPEAPASALLNVPDTARSTFFTLPSAMNSRSSLFGRLNTAQPPTSTSGSGNEAQEDKPRSSFFKLPNLSRGSFVATFRRERDPSRGRNPFDTLQTVDDNTSSFAQASIDLRESGYIPWSKRSGSIGGSMSNLLAGIDIVDIAPHPNSSVRQRSRTLSTKSASDTPDQPQVSLRSSTGLPLPTRPSTAGPSGFGSLSKRRPHMSVPPKLCLDTCVSSGNGSLDLEILSPLLMAPLPTLMLPPSRLDETLPLVPSEPTGMSKLELYSPCPTIFSATSASSTLRDSLLSNYDIGSSESDHEHSLALGEDECGPVNIAGSLVRNEEALDSGRQAGDPMTDATSPTLTSIDPGPPRSMETLNRSGPITFSFPGPPALPYVSQSPFRDPLESYFDVNNTPGVSSGPDNSSESSTPKADPSKAPGAPARQLSVNAFRAGNTPPARRLKFRRPESVPTIATGTVRCRFDELPDEPSMTSFVGLAWPRPPLRQIYLDTQNPSASWHTVSHTTDERLFSGNGAANIGPCHVIILARTIDTSALPDTLPGMCERQSLSLSATSALIELAGQTTFITST